MRTIGIDYSATTAYIVCLEDGAVYRHLSLTSGESLNERLQFFRSVSVVLRSLYKNEKVAEGIWIEEPWVNGRWFPKSGLMLTRMATYLEIAVLQNYFEPKLVHPLTWRKEIFGTARTNGLAKEKSVEWAEANLKFIVPVMGSTGRGKIKDHNFADAACIAAYGSIQNERGTDTEC